jgi:hypothetical protein
MKWPLALLALLALLAAPLALALVVEVDPTGGALVLEERVNAALDVWREAGVDVAASPRRVLVAYGDRLLLGPDVPVLVRTSVDPELDLELLVHPDLVDRQLAALVYALGIALGGEPGEGALDPRIAADAVVPPTAEQVAALAAAAAAEPAELDGAGVVGFGDLLILAERFGQRGVNVPGDLDGDGVVDDADLAILRARYTFEAPSTTPPPAPPQRGTDDPPLPPVPGGAGS